MSDRIKDAFIEGFIEGYEGEANEEHAKKLSKCLRERKLSVWKFVRKIIWCKVNPNTTKRVNELIKHIGYR